MNSLNKQNNKWMFLTNLIIVISSFIVVIHGVIYGAGSGQLGDDMIGLRYFIAFTNLSNIFNAIVCFMVLTFNINNLIQNKTEMSDWLTILNYTSCASVTLTFVTVVFFLAPMQVIAGNSYFIHFQDDLFFFHFLNPVLTIINVIVLNKNYHFNKRDNLYALIPVLMYIVLYTSMVLSNTWSDFYGFTFGGKMFMVPIAIIVMSFVTYMLGFIIRKIHNKLI